MRVALRNATLLATILIVCAPSCAAALTFAEAPGSPYFTTDQSIVPHGNEFLGGEVAGDFNGDGISDLAVVNSTGLPAPSSGESVTILLGHPDGQLTIAPDSPVELYSGGIFASHGVIATGDFNNDGKLDLAVVDEVHNTISILLGDGTGRFRLSGTPIPYLGEEPNAIAVGDFNGDGVEDLAFASDGEVNVLLGDGKGGFAPAPGSPFATVGYAKSVASGDFNANKRSDLAVTTNSNQVAIYLANGEGRFQQAEGSPMATGEGSNSIVASDLNGDGRADLAIVNEDSSNVSVLLGDGPGRFAPAPGSPFAVAAGPNASPEAPGWPDSIAAGDFNGDGHTDLAVANFNGSSDDVAILEGDGEGGFANASGSPFPANGNPRPLAVGDFNGDGRLDLSVVNAFQGVVTVLLNTSERALSPQPPIRTTVKTPTVPLPTLTRTKIIASIARQLRPRGGWMRLLSSQGNASFSFPFEALDAGNATLDLYALPRNNQHARDARDAHTKPVILASGKLTFATATTKIVRIKFTKAGALLLKQAKSLQLDATVIFTPTGMKAVAVTRTLLLKR